jgi:DNA-directed RNA polymerase subunit RPC12/RpoP
MKVKNYDEIAWQKLVEAQFVWKCADCGKELPIANTVYADAHGNIHCTDCRSATAIGGIK